LAIFDDQQTFIAKTAASCRFALDNTRRIRAFLIEPNYFLSRAWSFLDWTAMIIWLHNIPNPTLGQLIPDNIQETAENSCLP